MPLATGPGAPPTTPVPEDLTPAEFARLFVQTPEGAATYLEGRKRLTQTYDWRELWQEEHAHQFTVSRLARLDLLAAIQDGITKSVGGDLTRRDFERSTTKLLQESGWWGKVEVVDPNTGEVLNTRFDPNRVKLIYDVNTRMAHSAGRWQRFEQSAGTHPYLRYITKGDERVRASHAAWHNVTLPIGHPVWKTHYPPCGWHCRCRAMAVSQAQYEAGQVPYRDRETGELRMAQLDKTAPKVEWVAWKDKRTGETRDVPAGIDPGFGYNVGIAAQRAAELAKQVEAKLAAVPPVLAAAANKAVVTLPTPDVAAFVADARSVADRQMQIDFGPVTGVEAILRETGLDLTGYARAMDNYGVRHTLKQHGNPAREAARGQIAVSEHDFALVELITSAWDRVFLDGKNAIGRDVIVFVKVIDGVGYRYVEEIRPRARLVALDSLRKKMGMWQK
ncbi:phage minor head protein [uncultured Thiodictyon sp.]|uniref:phage minor head protein n=1 Tax=uncultured Thiodictyon sp. TaxID=1846217 RepID=UPI0025E899BF|nr:phage minor head protein [uncultured Thiodictyon sp.]